MYHAMAPVLVSKGFQAVIRTCQGWGSLPIETRHHFHPKMQATRPTPWFNFFGYDKGCGPAVLLARDHPDLLESIIVAERLQGFSNPQQG